MPQFDTGVTRDGTSVVRMTSDRLVVDVAPGVGGRVVSLIDRASNHEFLWNNERLRLERKSPGSEYDPNFYGGIDELIPNDIPEQIDDVAAPDHGELWTTALDHAIEDGALVLRGTLPLTGLVYERRMTLSADSPQIDLGYRIQNPTGRLRRFMWKLHAALAIRPGDVIDCPARRGQVAHLDYSRYETEEPFDWPIIEGQAANVAVEKDGTCDFFYLFDLTTGRMGWHRPGTGLRFEYVFDRDVFRYAWLFASYGGLDGHYTAVLEPCTTMPLSVGEAAAKGQCSSLEPGSILKTNVTIRVAS
ncbi:MAG: hypothetical protein JXQ73_24780 [Phycisphaerae bacterium]|nr:hypothetical protein [Phycisphaerae bacterium]